ncbi:MAG: SpoIIE family protein phosphatase [Oscillospiraceae bacterium]|nr:SpoIIE family protein phosphatase [Oscillospiraceae bacterium]
MKIIHGIKIGGLQQKIFNLMLIVIIAMIGIFLAVSLYQQHNLAHIVEQSNTDQQTSIAQVSDATMQTVLESSMSKTTALQAYIAGDLFSDVQTDVQTLQTFATELFAHADSFSPHPFYLPDKNNDGVASVMVQHETGVDPTESESLGLVANMSEIMLSMFVNSRWLSSCFVGTADGNILFVDDRAGAYLDENGMVYDFEVRSRPWYKQAAEAGRLIFTGIEEDAFTGIKGVVCAAPIYRDGELVAVVGADLFLTSISDYVENTVTDSSFLCVINEHGQVIFSPQKEGSLKPELSSDAPDLRQSDNEALAHFVTEALNNDTGLESVTIDGTAYYLMGVPIFPVGWTVVSVANQEAAHRPTETLLDNYKEINQRAMGVFREGAKHGSQTFIVLTTVMVLLGMIGALLIATHIVKPVEHMTRRINSLSGDNVFEMETIYCTGDEIEVLAESFTSLSKKTRDYIRQITEITAEKERIGTELALAKRIQADMLPNTYPAFPERPEFDIYASMDPAKEVGGDFYDYFLVDDDHLCMLIADVSGKGVPAALFMMASRIILAGYAKQGLSPAEILHNANETICRNNREEMFVTVWLGILEISTGRITAANAGHEYPVLMQPDRKCELYKGKHGFVIGGIEGAKYKEYELRLQPGGKLFLYTDGVAEATSAENELFGTARMLDALSGDPDADPERILTQVRRAVDDFVGDAEQFDDLTMLCLEYKG